MIIINGYLPLCTSIEFDGDFISTSSINELVGHNDFIPNFVYRAHFLIYTTPFARNVIHIAISSVAYWIQQLNSSFDIISCSTIISNTLNELKT